LYMTIQWTFLPSLVQICLWFQKKRWKCEIPIGSNVHGRNVHCMVIYKIFVFGADRKSNMAARAHNVFWLAQYNLLSGL
jgi:hypothetical protein